MTVNKGYDFTHPMSKNIIFKPNIKRHYEEKLEIIQYSFSTYCLIFVKFPRLLYSSNMLRECGILGVCGKMMNFSETSILLEYVLGEKFR